MYLNEIGEQITAGKPGSQEDPMVTIAQSILDRLIRDSNMLQALRAMDIHQALEHYALFKNSEDKQG